MFNEVPFNMQVLGNKIIITPKESLGNSEYKVKIKRVESVNKKNLNNIDISFYTSFSPQYCSLFAVRSLIEDCDVDDFTILYHIRDASKFARYIKPSIDEKNIPYEVEQFTKYKAAYDCVLKIYISKSAANGEKGTLGDVSYDNQVKFNDLSKLLKHLKDLIDYWLLFLRGLGLPGYAKPKVANRGANSKTSIASASKEALLQPLNLDYSRGV